MDTLENVGLVDGESVDPDEVMSLFAELVEGVIQVLSDVEISSARPRSFSSSWMEPMYMTERCILELRQCRLW
jgi:hypothetical protein